MSLVNSCRDCADRKVGCHSTCEKYKQFRAKLDEINEKRHKENDVNNYSWELIRRNRERGIKKNKRFTRHND